MKTFELKPIDGRKSFCNKAIVTENNGIATLMSYTTNVAEINLQTKEFKEHGKYSKTTDRHVKAFKQFYNL